jgi:hypothetical protein
MTDLCCDSCSKSFNAVPRAPMLVDSVWLCIAKRDEYLCAGCMFERAVACGLDLTLSELQPLPFNLLGNPSWYDLFAGSQSENTTINLDAWRKAMLIAFALEDSA